MQAISATAFERLQSSTGRPKVSTRTLRFVSSGLSPHRDLALLGRILREASAHDFDSGNLRGMNHEGISDRLSLSDVQPCLS